MEDEDRGAFFTLFLLLIISFFLVLVDSLEMYNVINSWSYGVTILGDSFESCVKWELYTKTAFGAFSLLGAISAFILTIFILIDSYWFAEKILHSFLWFNYLVFGPYMLGFCIIGFYNWSNVAYVCDKQNFKIKNVSPPNIFSLVGCFLVSFLVSILVGIFNTTFVYIDSILRKPRGYKLIRKLFWWYIFRNTEPEEFVRRTVRNQNVNEENQGRNNV
jgi:hypothetical protein